jgi:hypothetical protein
MTLSAAGWFAGGFLRFIHRFILFLLKNDII